MTETTALARRFRLDVETATGVWTQMLGVTDFNYGLDATMQDSSSYDTDGWGADEKTFQKWFAEVTAFRRKDSGVYDPAVEKCRIAADGFEADSRVNVRWYDRTGGDEAYSGTATVTYERSNTGVTDLDAVKIRFAGYGEREVITNPVDDLDPVVVAVVPNTAADDALIYITGNYFTGATDVDFGATAATQFTVINDNTIAVVVPTLSSGAQNVTVTTPEGVSNAGTFTAP